MTPEKFSCAIGGRRGNSEQTFHVELREIYVTPEKYFSGNSVVPV